MKQCLIVADVQNDFYPGGNATITNSDKINNVINNLLPNYDLVIFTKNWHPEGMKGFASSYKSKKPFDTRKVKGVETLLWPDHCIQNTPGSDIHSDINLGLIKNDFYIFKKCENKNDHCHSAFSAEGLTEFLKERNIEDIHICGLTLDYSCKETAIDSVKEGFNTTIILDATKPLNSNIDDTLIDFYEFGVNIIESWELPLYKLLIK